VIKEVGAAAPGAAARISKGLACWGKIPQARRRILRAKPWQDLQIYLRAGGEVS